MDAFTAPSERATIRCEKGHHLETDERIQKHRVNQESGKRKGVEGSGRSDGDVGEQEQWRHLHY